MVSSNIKSLHLILRTVKLSNKILNNSTATTTLNLARSVSITKSRSFEIKATKKTQTQTASAASSAPIPPPNFDGQSKEYSPKIHNLVEEIARLNLIEVSDLNELLRKKLNIKDVPVSYGAFPGAGAPVAAAKAEEPEPEAAAPQAVKTSFKLKITKYDEAKKVALIKEIKTLGENLNLVQAKKFIESVPQVFKDNIGKEEAEKIKAQLEKAGAVCEIE
jgi:large subunit ribosomal protein L7/L12